MTKKYDPVVPYTSADACWCAPGTGPANPKCPMHGEDQRQAKFVAVGRVIMRGVESIGKARTHTMALRIANALNSYVPSKKGF